MIRFRAQVFTSLRVWVLAGHRAKPSTAASAQLLPVHPYYPGPWNAHSMAEREKKMVSPGLMELLIQLVKGVFLEVMELHQCTITLLVLESLQLKFGSLGIHG